MMSYCLKLLIMLQATQLSINNIPVESNRAQVWTAQSRTNSFLFKQPIYAITAVNPNISLWKKVENRRVLSQSQAVGI